MKMSEKAACLPPVLRKIIANQSLLKRKGTIVATWRTYKGRRLGPYYRLVYYQRGRQRSIYLGRSAELVMEVQDYLAELQQPAKTDRALRRMKKEFKTAMHEHKKRFHAELAAVGLKLRGYTVHGWRCWDRLQSRSGVSPLQVQRNNAPYES
ncbi:MAG: hypothetical protein JXB10_10805 [Pirellulales bacterium]|nr:hypothetical protein [Pirellulales bacterium]